MINISRLKKLLSKGMRRWLFVQTSNLTIEPSICIILSINSFDSGEIDH